MHKFKTETLTCRTETSDPTLENTMEKIKKKEDISIFKPQNLPNKLLMQRILIP